MDGEASRAEMRNQCQAQASTLGRVPERLIIHTQVKGAGLVGRVGPSGQNAKDKGIQGDEEKKGDGGQGRLLSSHDVTARAILLMTGPYGVVYARGTMKLSTGSPILWAVGITIQVDEDQRVAPAVRADGPAIFVVVGD